MSRKPADVTNTELGILKCLWDEGPATIGQITSQLYPEQNTSEYATVQSLLQRLEAKGCVARNRKARAHVFSAVVQREDLIGSQLESLASRLCGGSITPLLTHLVRNSNLSEDEHQQVRTILSEIDQRPT